MAHQLTQLQRQVGGESADGDVLQLAAGRDEQVEQQCTRLVDEGLRRVEQQTGGIVLGGGGGEREECTEEDEE